MERLRQVWAGFMVKLYGPTPPPAVWLPFPQSTLNMPNPLRRPNRRGARRPSPQPKRSPIVKKPPKPRFCRTTKEYGIRLARLVSGHNRLVIEEQRKLDISEQITQQAAVEDASNDSSAPLDLLLGQQAIVESTIKDELNEMAESAALLLDSLDAQGANRSPLPLPLIEQLRRFDRPRGAYVAQRISEENEREEIALLRKIDAVLYLAANRTNNRGWIPTQSRLILIRARRGEIVKRRRIVEICKERMTNELRRLCTVEAPMTLNSPAFRPEDARLRKLRRRRGSP